MSAGVLDLHQVVRNWAWKVYDLTATSKEKKLRKKQKKADPNSSGVGGYIGVQIDWSEVKFRDETKWAPLTDVELTEDDSGATGGNKSVDRDTGGRPDASAPGAGLLFQTTYTNETNETQEYTIKTEKTTKTSCSTEIESCYTKGYEMSITLKAPGDLFEANAGYHREYSLTNTDGETFEEELTWGVDSLIKVSPKHMATASLKVTEKKQEGNFDIRSEIQGMVFVTFTNIRDDNSLLKATGEDIAEIVKIHKKKECSLGKDMSFVDIEDGKVKVKTVGRCNFRYGIKQEVKVNQVKIPGS